MPERDDEWTDELLEDDGVRYTGGDYDPSKVNVGDSEYYAASSPEDSIDVIPGSNIEDDFESDFDLRRDESDPRDVTQIDLRSREDILNEVNNIIRDGISVDVNDTGEVTLKGVVDSEESKRILGTGVEAIAGVRRVHNWIRVDPLKS